MPHLQLSSEEIEALHLRILAPPEEPLRDLPCDDCDQVYQHGLQLAREFQEAADERGRRRHTHDDGGGAAVAATTAIGAASPTAKRASSGPTPAAAAKSAAAAAAGAGAASTSPRRVFTGLRHAATAASRQRTLRVRELLNRAPAGGELSRALR